MKREEETFTTGSGDIFKDLGFSDEEAAELNLKSYLLRTLQKALKDTGKSQTELAARLGIPQPKVSDILNGKMSGFSVERLANYLLKMGYDICIDTKPATPGKSGKVIQHGLVTA